MGQKIPLFPTIYTMGENNPRVRVSILIKLELHYAYYQRNSTDKVWSWLNFSFHKKMGDYRNKLMKLFIKIIEYTEKKFNYKSYTITTRRIIVFPQFILLLVKSYSTNDYFLHLLFSYNLVWGAENFLYMRNRTFKSPHASLISAYPPPYRCKKKHRFTIMTFALVAFRICPYLVSREKHFGK